MIKYSLVIICLFTCLLSVRADDDDEIKTDVVSWSLVNQDNSPVEKLHKKHLKSGYYFNDIFLGFDDEGIDALCATLKKTKNKSLVIQLSGRKESTGISQRDMPSIFTKHMEKVISICRFKKISIALDYNKPRWGDLLEGSAPKIEKHDFGQ